VRGKLVSGKKWKLSDDDNASSKCRTSAHTIGSPEVWEKKKIFTSTNSRVKFEDPLRVCNGTAGSTPTASRAQRHSLRPATRGVDNVEGNKYVRYRYLVNFNAIFVKISRRSKATDKLETFSNFLNFSWEKKIAIYSC
jgi:hypothetical protein